MLCEAKVLENFDDDGDDELGPLWKVEGDTRVAREREPEDARNFC